MGRSLRAGIPVSPTLALRRARRLGLVLLLAAEAAAVVAVHRLGAQPPFDLPLDDVDPWVRAAPADALLAALRLATLGAAAWLFAVTAAYALARGLGIRSVLGVLEHATPHLVRRVVDHAIAASIVVGALAAPVHAASAPAPVVVDVRNGRQHGSGSLTSLPPDSRRVSDAPPRASVPRVTAPTLPVPAASPAPRPVPAPPAAPTTAVVQRGDNLWTIAADALARATMRDRADLDDAEIARYWRAICDANAATVRSGNLDVIVAGEVIALPPVS
jgi:hypothetical protein